MMIWIVLGVGILLAFYILRSATKFIIKLASFLLLLVFVVFGAYVLELGPFQKDILAVKSLKKAYCKGPEKNELACNCLVQPLDGYLNDKFSTSERKELSANRWVQAYTVTQAIREIKPEIKDCLKAHDYQGNVWSFLTEYGSEILPDSSTSIWDQKRWIDDKLRSK